MLGDVILASWGHLVSAIFLGLVPVLLIALVTGLLIGLVVWLSSLDHAGALFGYALFFAAVGASLGLMLGASREPAVKAFLPALLTLLAGLFIYVFPREVNAGRMRLTDDAKADTPTFVRSFVIVGIAGLMISATMGSFWGGSIRGLKEEDARRHAAWEAEYKTIELPVRLETIRRELGLEAAAEDD